MKTNEKVSIMDLRETLKTTIQKELEQLPETLKELDPVKRLSILCKLMPYVLPKTDSVKHDFGDPDENIDEVTINIVRN